MHQERLQGPFYNHALLERGCLERAARARRAGKRALSGAILALGLASATNARATQECNAGPYVAGVDVSGGEGSLDWTQAAGAGIKFAFMKATQGNYYTDSEFSANWSGTKAAGIIRGAYHFFDGTIGGAEQAQYFLQTVGTIGPGDLPPVLDIECPDSTPGDDCLGNGSSGAASSATLTQAMNDFLTTVKAATGRTPIVYSYGSWFSDNSIDTTGLTNYPLWIADPTTGTCFTVPAPWASATFWQYSFTGDIPGIGSGGDLDYFLGTMAQLTSFLSSGVGPVTDAGIPPEVDSGLDGGTSCFVPALNADGDCILTTECEAMPNHVATAGFCPGPDDIQCCTSTITDSGMPTMKMDSGMTMSGMDSGTVPKTDSGSTSGLDATTGFDSGTISEGDAGHRVVGGDAGEEPPEEHGHNGGGCACRTGLGGQETGDGPAGGIGLLIAGTILARRSRRRTAF